MSNPNQENNQKITPFLWFDKNAEEAVNFYVSVFKNSKVVAIHRYPDKPINDRMKDMAGKVLTAIFELNGQRFMAIDGGPMFKFTEAMSLYVECKDQAEVDYFWDKLSADPNGGMCGWLKDKYGLSWQIIPKGMGELISSPDAMAAMMRMKKIVIADLVSASKS